MSDFDLGAHVVATTDVALADLLEETSRLIGSYVVLTPEQNIACALWVAHTHAIEAADFTPYLNVSSPTRESGKTRLQEVLALITRNPEPTANISDAALFRLIEQKPTTLLFDEVDSIFSPKARDREDLRGLLNAGYERGGVATRCVGDGAKLTVKQFNVFCPKVLAGIGQLPETIASRSIPIRMQRKAPGEQVERFRKREARRQTQPLRDALAAWAIDNTDALAVARPDLPDDLGDRQQDIWEPLLAIADLAGGRWPAAGRSAAVALHSGEEQVSRPVELLRAIRDAFDALDVDRLHTNALIEQFAENDESPYAAWWNPKDEAPERWAPRRLAKQLAGFDIKSEQIWDRDTKKNRHGYRREMFDTAFARYLRDDAGSSVPDGPSVTSSVSLASEIWLQEPSLASLASQRENGRRAVEEPTIEKSATLPLTLETLEALEPAWLSENVDARETLERGPGTLEPGGCPLCGSGDIGLISGTCRTCGTQARPRDASVYGDEAA